MIKSAIPNFGEINLGTLFPNGRLQTNYISDSAHRIGDRTIADDYLDGIAKLVPDASVRRDGSPWNWRVEVLGELPSITSILDHAEQWLLLMKDTRRRFIEASNARRA